jgi:hypothetical protein
LSYVMDSLELYVPIVLAAGATDPHYHVGAWERVLRVFLIKIKSLSFKALNAIVRNQI